MGIRQEPVYFCDNCGIDIENNPFITTYAVPHEGCSEITCTNGLSFEVQDGHYCNLECLFKKITTTLFPPKSKAKDK